MKDVNYLKQNGVNIEKSLELFGDLETYIETLTEFLKNVDARVEELKKYKEIADMSNYSVIVHSLKSDMRYFGFDKLADDFYKHEIESKNNNMYYVYENYDILIDGLKNMIEISNKFLGNNVVEKIDVDDDIEILDKETILVVDDSDIIQSFIKKVFENKFNVLIAKDGKEALNIIINNDQYNVIAMLLDLNLPNVNGFSVLNFMKQKELFDKLPTSIITGVGDDDIVNQAFNYKIVDILRKPFNERDVKTVIEKTICSKK